MAVSRGQGSQYSDSRYGVVQRAYNFPLTKDDVAGVGTLAESFITLPVKARILKFGIQSAASDINSSTDTTFELRTINGTKLATFVLSSDHAIIAGSGEATGVTPETATTVGANVPMVCCVGTNPGTTGSVYYFVDWTEDSEPTIDN